MSSTSDQLRALADLQQAIDAHQAAVADLGPVLDAVIAAGAEASVEQVDLLHRLTAKTERRDLRVQQLAVLAGVAITEPTVRSSVLH